jgi:glycosyltransferase involved in cell wall biosynthesis
MNSTEIKQKPLVSIVIPTHNRAQLLEEALVSVLSQQGAGEDFELETIVVDDASSDETPELMRKYSQARHIRLTTNHGEGGARNVGIKASRGKYIAFLDDDDLMLPGRLQLQVPAMEAHPEVGVVYSQNLIKSKWSEAHRATSIPGADVIWPDARRAPSGDVFATFLKEEFLSMDTLMVRRDAFDKAGYFESYPTGAHYDMFLRLAFHVPFLFVEGNVAITWANPAGVFHARLAGEDGYGRMLPVIADKALAMLPDSVYSRRLRRDVHVALVPRLLCMLERIPDLEGMRSYVRIVLRECPWLLTEAGARCILAESARFFRLNHVSPIAVTTMVCEEIIVKAKKGGFKDRLKLRTLLAQIWIVLAMTLAFSKPCDRGRTCQAAGRAFLYDPRRLLSGECLKLVVRVLVGARAYSVLALLKRPARAPISEIQVFER